MSIIELLNEIGKLAQIINEKNQELESLRQSYDAKLQIINQYIENLKLPPTSTISDEELIAQISQPIECLKCLHRVWENSKESEFLLIPKSKIERVSKVVENTTPTAQAAAPSHTAPLKPSKNKSKIECSYCKKTGHTRAKCRVRLSTPK
ncbi:hypothetical protein Cantr_09475 [Candida viswanathii]|uniref:CCHC-type domain-containing protein n=1 Tax=Candida viswanathii TaxID=5486 RepID=A0A367YBG2_9ASCO|nr:hypothetical protein Cantr_09475 [Candida viswanathii]